MGIETLKLPRVGCHAQNAMKKMPTWLRAAIGLWAAFVIYAAYTTGNIRGYERGWNDGKNAVMIQLERQVKKKNQE